MEPISARANHSGHERQMPCGSSKVTNRDGGFILVTLGLLIIPIIAFTALAVDVSSWYSRATELQRAADSAALAGAVWMPDMGAATSNATSSLKTNGVVPGVAGMNATIQAGSQTNSLRVCVTDSNAPQFFSGVFSGPESITRCGTALFNVPLQLGSPLNYFGGNQSVSTYVPGSQPVNAQPVTPPASNFGSYAYCRISTTSYWNKNNSRNPSDWYYRINNITSGPICSTPKPIYPDTASFFGASRCNVVVGGTTVGYWTTGKYYYPLPGGYSGAPTCGYNGASQGLIPPEKSPGMWAAVEGTNTGANNGDQFSTKTCPASTCGVSSSTNPDYRSSGYYYSLDALTNSELSFQAFDAGSNSGLATGDQGASVTTTYRVMDSGTTPYDFGDDTQICSQTLTNTMASGPIDTSGRWWEFCNFTPQTGHRYYINVYSSGSSSGYNGYALRVVAGTFAGSCLAANTPGTVACYGATGTVQPVLSAYGDMEMYNGIKAGAPTKFFLANVTQVYAGKTLSIKLWDPGDGTNEIDVSMLRPGPPMSGTPESGVVVPVCSWKRYKIDGSNDNNTSYPNSASLNGGPGCKIETNWPGMSSGGSPMNARLLEIHIDIPTTYTCDKTVDPTADSGSCWWQIQYDATDVSSDYTTWSAAIIGDPVRLVQN